MTLKEFSNEFDVLYNNIMSNASPGLNEYEKSVFLTQAQDEIVIALYNGTLPQYGSFEETEELRNYLDSLLNKEYVSIGILYNDLKYKSVYCTLPSNLLFIIHERAVINSVEQGVEKEYEVIPTTYDNLNHMLKNPFSGILSNRVLRLNKSTKTVELIFNHNINFNSYVITYLKNPKPIILDNISILGAKIKGLDVPTVCELHESIHLLILKLAVQKAAQSYKM